MKDLLAAERYARALFELARAERLDEAVEAELLSFSAALTASPDLEKFLENPQLGPAEKKKFLAKIYPPASGGTDSSALRAASRAHELLLAFFTVLLEKGRLNLIHEITKSFKRIADAAQGQAPAEIRTARPLSPKDETRLVSTLEKMAGFKIEAEKKIDASLIGGVVVRMRNKILDGSVKNRLSFLKKELTKKQTI